MDTYLVGGAVRDALLGLPVVDRDRVVVGATARDMLDAGYVPVGRDFPVFLHPETHEEHALARTERKSGPGYRGFEVHSDPSVTLEEDLARRDLTINAMARADDGRLIDPYGGAADLESRTLRHVSDAFVEDPVRVLRLARFAARLAPLGFAVAPETLALARRMVESGEMAALVPERVWQELVGALSAARPRAFFETLRACGALGATFPEVDALYGVPQPERHHPEVDVGEHVMLVLDRAAELSDALDARFAALCHDFGKATTPAEDLPSHPGHEERGAAIADAFCERLRAPCDERAVAVLTARWHTHCHRAAELRPATVADLLAAFDVARRPARLDAFLVACEADARGRLGMQDRDCAGARTLRRLADAWLSVDAGAIARATADRARVPETIRIARIDAIRAAREGVPNET